jgi:hypothetical protein
MSHIELYSWTVNSLYRIIIRGLRLEICARGKQALCVLAGKKEFRQDCEPQFSKFPSYGISYCTGEWPHSTAMVLASRSIKLEVMKKQAFMK